VEGSVGEDAGVVDVAFGGESIPEKFVRPSIDE